LRVLFLKSGTVQVVQFRHFVGREQGPRTVFGNALHEKVGNPVGGIDVVGASPVVAGVFAQVEEVLDIVVPGFQVDAGGAAALAAPVDGDGDVIGNLQERNHSLGANVGRLDQSPSGADVGPVRSDAAGILRHLGIVAIYLEDVRQ